MVEDQEELAMESADLDATVNLDESRLGTRVSAVTASSSALSPPARTRLKEPTHPRRKPASLP